MRSKRLKLMVGAVLVAMIGTIFTGCEPEIEIVTDEEFSPFEVLSDPHPVNIVDP